MQSALIRCVARKVLVQMNNINPLLVLTAPDRLGAEDWTICMDGMEFQA
jgi:hypothetical protein